MRSCAYLLLLSVLSAGISTPQESGFSASQSYPERMRGRSELVYLTLREAVVLALKANLDVRVENYKQDLAAAAMLSAIGNYDPVIGFQAGLSGQSAPSISVLQGAQGLSVQSSHGMTLGPTITENLPGGTQIGLSFTATRNTTNNAYTFLNPAYGGNLGLTINQPLWRGAFSQDPTLYRIRISRLNQKITDSQFHQKLSDIVQQVENQYWTLALALRIYEVQRQSRELARIQYEDAVQKVQAGILPHVAIASAKAEIASRDQQTIASELQIVNAENALKLLLSPGPDAELWKSTILPSDKPAIEDPGVTMDGAVQTALSNRPELEQLQLALQQNTNDLKFYRNSTRPTVSLQATAGSMGQSGQLIPGYVSPLTVTSDVLSAAGVGGLSSAVSQAFEVRYPSWTAGINAQYTLFNRTAKASVANAEIVRRQLDSQLKSARQAVLAQTRNAYEGLIVQEKTWESARLAAQYCREQLEGETARFQAGFTTNFEVLRYQRDLASAEVQEVQALIGYRISLASLRAAMDTLIDAHDIAIGRQH